MVRPTLKKQIPNLQEAIKETAWKQIAEFGAPTLSLPFYFSGVNWSADAELRIAKSRERSLRTGIGLPAVSGSVGTPSLSRSARLTCSLGDNSDVPKAVSSTSLWGSGVSRSLGWPQLTPANEQVLRSCTYALLENVAGQHLCLA